MDILEAILNRRTIKKYTNQPVEKDDLEAALKAACWAPSHRNSQPWEFRVLMSEAIIKLGGIYADRVLNHPRMPEEKKSKKLKFAKEFGGAHAVVVALCKEGKDERENQENLEAIGASLQNFYLALHAKGIATAWLTPSVLMNDHEVNDLIKISPGFSIVGILPVGYPLEIPGQKEREGLDKKVKWIG